MNKDYCFWSKVISTDEKLTCLQLAIIYKHSVLNKMELKEDVIEVWYKIQPSYCEKPVRFIPQPKQFYVASHMYFSEDVDNLN